MNQLGLSFEFSVNDHILIESSTANPSITMTMAMMTLLLSYNSGVRKFGAKGYFANYVRPVGFSPPINTTEEFANLLTLLLRLYGNIYTGEALLTLIGGCFTKSVGWLTVIASVSLTLIWQGFSVFIGSTQAYVFVTLSMVYIGERVTEK